MTSGPQLSILFGLSGVGKTTMGRAVIERNAGVSHVSASDLLKAAHSQTGEELRTAKRDRLVANQGALADALRAWPFPVGTNHVLLDAHSVIDNDRVLVDIPISAIAPLSPNRLIFISDDPAAIAGRRRSDTRQRPIRTPEELDSHQNRSWAVCQGFSEAMRVPLLRIRSGDVLGFRVALGLEVQARGSNSHPRPPRRA